MLIQADTGVKTTNFIIQDLKKQLQQGSLEHGESLKHSLGVILKGILTKNALPQTPASINLLVGINGSGKTTFASKLAHQYRRQGKRVLMVAADTFRAAAAQQLAQWAKITNTTIIQGSPGQDPASVVFAGCEKFKNEKFDVLIIDTAGRLQTKLNLMRELTKIKRIITRIVPDQSTCTLLTIDSMLGQNSFEQAKLFKESTDVNGIVLTKMDGTGKGGIVFGIAKELEVPIAYVTFGEKPEQIKEFNAQEYVSELLG